MLDRKGKGNFFGFGGAICLRFTPALRFEQLQTTSPEEPGEIDALLVSRDVNDWRDVEALAARNTPRARALRVKTLRTGTKELAIAVADHAPDLVAERTKTDLKTSGLEVALPKSS